MSEDAMIECPFCASPLKAHATVCPNCQAVRGAGADTHGNVRGSGYVAFIRVLLGGWAMVIVISLTIGLFRNEGGPLVLSMVLGIIWLPLFLKNLGLIFNNGKEDRWYRKT